MQSVVFAEQNIKIIVREKKIGHIYISKVIASDHMIDDLLESLPMTFLIISAVLKDLNY